MSKLETTVPQLTHTPASAVQVGGDHYKKLAIQPAYYCHVNGLGVCESNVIKYVSRHEMKGGREDIEKAIHWLQLLLEFTYDSPQSREDELQDLNTN